MSPSSSALGTSAATLSITWNNDDDHPQPASESQTIMFCDHHPLLASTLTLKKRVHSLGRSLRSAFAFNDEGLLRVTQKVRRRVRLTTQSMVPDLMSVSAMSSACSPLSGWEMYRLSTSTPADEQGGANPLKW
jgi:hypothetical protein